MDYYGLLFLYYLKGLSGKSVLKLFFNIEAGGTEQLLPENTSTPTTTPILADIQYPDGLRTDQYFTYRETPTTVSNKARIKTIKGNTLNWNQIYNVNSDRTNIGVNIKVVNGAVSITGTSTNVGTGPAFAWTDFKGVIGHKYIITKDFTLPTGDYIFDQYNLNSSTDITTVVFTLNNNDGFIIPQLRVAQSGVTYNINGHLCVYDLTKMFGAGNEPTTVEEFKSLFPLSYYSYNQGSLLSFMGNGIKTVGKNLLSFPYASGSTSTITVNNDGSLSINKTASGDIYFNLYTADNGLKLPSGDYIIKSHNALPSNVGIYCVVRLNGTTITNISLDRNNLQRTINIPNGAIFICYMQLASAFIGQTEIKLTMSVEDMDAFEPYTSSTLSLPISTYFPTGMKSAGNAYDELLPNKAITRVGIVDLGSLNWSRRNDVNGAFFTKIDDMALGVANKLSNLLCPLYATRNTAYYGQLSSFVNMEIAQGNATQGEVYLVNTSYSDVTTFKTAMSGVYLYYELATPTETPITTEDANEALSLLMGKSVSSNNAKQMIDIITKGE